MSKRNRTPEQKAAWAEYMREYRRKNPEQHGDRAQPHLEPTQRQLEILRTYADPIHGGRYDRVAAHLGISPSAVHNAMGRLLARLGVRDPSQAVMKLWVNSASTIPVPEPTSDESAAQRGRRQGIHTVDDQGADRDSDGDEGMAPAERPASAQPEELAQRPGLRDAGA